MKAFPALILAAALLAPTVHAQETPAAPAPQETAPAPEAPAAEAPAPAPEPKAKPAPDLTPAQDIPMPKKETGLDLMPAQDTPQMFPEPVLIPETPESTPKPEGSAIEEPKKEKGKEKVKQDKTAAAADEMASRIRYRQAKTRALKDPAVQAEWAKAAKARTDYARREALTNYYTLLYARMEKLDASLKKEIASRQIVSLRRIKQARLDPTEAPVIEETPVVSSRDSGQFFE